MTFVPTNTKTLFDQEPKRGDYVVYAQILAERHCGMSVGRVIDAGLRPVTGLDGKTRDEYRCVVRTLNRTWVPRTRSFTDHGNARNRTLWHSDRMVVVPAEMVPQRIREILEK